MLALDDPKWRTLNGGYRTPYDPTAALRNLYAREDQEGALSDMWEELHHQGDLGEASYAAVPHLVKIQKDVADLDYNLYALIATIEIERHRRKNPPMPEWLAGAYESAWKELLPVALRDYASASDPETVEAILGVLAICKGLMETGSILCQFGESEIKEIFDRGMA